MKNNICIEEKEIPRVPGTISLKQYKEEQKLLNKAIKKNRQSFLQKEMERQKKRAKMRLQQRY